MNQHNALTYHKFFFYFRCQYENECAVDTDCNAHGQCIRLDTTTYPKKVCFCEAGWMGRLCGQCKKQSSCTKNVNQSKISIPNPKRDRSNTNMLIQKLPAQMFLTEQKVPRDRPPIEKYRLWTKVLIKFGIFIKN